MAYIGPSPILNGHGFHTSLLQTVFELGPPVMLGILLILSMSQLTIDVSWWGQSALGTYMMHSWFNGSNLDRTFVHWVNRSGEVPVWGGVAQLSSIFLGAFLFMTFVGPLGRFILLAPSSVLALV